MQSNLYTMDKKFALASLELNEKEFGRFYNALHRVVYGATIRIQEIKK